MSAQSNLNNNIAMKHPDYFKRVVCFCGNGCNCKNNSRIRKENKIKRIAPPHRKFGFFSDNDNSLECK